MYRKGKEPSETAYEPMCEDEYELYRYNIPPRYDGSRFRRNRGGTKDAVVVSPSVCENTEEEVIYESEIPCAEESTAHGEQSTLARLGISIGREELLIIAVALAVAGGESKGDTLLLLALLLIAGD